MSNKRFIYIWEYIAKEERLSEFEEAYGSEGDWVKLFKKADGYITTEFFRDSSNALKFITIDKWESKAHRDTFREKFDKEFETLDALCEGFTEHEKWLGDFDSF